MKNRKVFWGHFLAFLTVFIWAVTFISIKVLLVPFSPVEIIVYRLIVAVLALLAVSPPRPAFPRLDSINLRKEAQYIVAGLLSVVLYSWIQNIALLYTLAGNVSVLTSTAPLFTALIARAIFKERFKANFMIGFFAAMMGIILITFNGSFVLKLNPIGDLLSILAAVVWACYTILTKNITAQQSNLISATRKVIFYGLVFTLLVSPLMGFQLGLERLIILPNLLNILFLGLCSSALCLVTWSYAVRILGPVKTSVYMYLSPIITIVASAVTLGETITLIAGAGMVLILIGMALSEREKTAAFAA
jgi:drug/metabolite transporter (DMT)-like permease